MFDFTHLRELANEMKEKAFAYAVNFWQKIFDTLDLDEDYPIEDYTEFPYFDLPDEADPLELFKGIWLKISYSYSGDIKVEIKWDEEDDYYNESCDSILREALLKNGFVMHRSNDNLYSYNISEI